MQQSIPPTQKIKKIGPEYARAAKKKHKSIKPKRNHTKDFIIFLLILITYIGSVAGFRWMTLIQYQNTLISDYLINEDNLLENGNFENGIVGWEKYSDKSASLIISDKASLDGSTAGRFMIGIEGQNTQLFQDGFILEPNTEYTLSFDVKSESGNDLQLYIQENKTPYRNLGLERIRIDVQEHWEPQSFVFATANFSGTTEATRLKFHFGELDQDNDIYEFDNITLTKNLD